MSTGKDKLAQDVDILAAMAAEMDAYLNSDVIFWKLEGGGMPALTLGGYLMRQHRLLALADLLDEGEKAKVETAVAQFNQALVEKIVRFEQKGNRELEARLRQWGEYLKDVDKGIANSASNYSAAVEVRAMIAALKNSLEMAPYKLNPDALRRIELLDKQLRRRWQHGPFIWPEEWKPAYPEPEYWWLYGHLKRKSH